MIVSLLGRDFFNATRSQVSSWDDFLASESLSESPGLCLRLETSSSNGFRTLDLKLFKYYRLVAIVSYI